MTNAIATFAIFLGDDALVLGHRLAQWSSRAPTLEEDLALSNLGLDLIGQARLLYTLACDLEGKGRTEDDLAYFREAHEFGNVLLVETPNGDFAHTMVRHLIYSALLYPYFDALSRSSHAGLAEIAAKAVKEMAYHVRHASEWVIRLGDGTEESRQRTVGALAAMWPYADELFNMTEVERQLAAQGIVPDRESLRAQWDRTIDRVLAEAGLERPDPQTFNSGGRSGMHTNHLAPMLAEMQEVARQHPGATW